MDAEESGRLEEDHRRLDHEVGTARALQMSLVPSAALTSGPWEVNGKVAPGRDVGHDYFDYFPFGDDRFGVTIAQCTGKHAMAAALLMSRVRALLHEFCRGGRAISEAVRQVNQGVVAGGFAGQCVALIYGEVDWGRGVLRYTNACHNYPMLCRRGGAIEELTVSGLPLGLFPDADYECGETAFAPGDYLLLYSASIYKTNDSTLSMFGEDHLRSLWQSYRTLPSGEIIDRLFKDVEGFRGGATQVQVEGEAMTAVIVGPRGDS